MSLVVNDHDDVADILTQHGGTVADYELAAYECQLCGNGHRESVHGEPLVMREWSVRTVEDAVIVHAYDALDLVERVPATGDQTFYGRMMTLINEWNDVTEDDELGLSGECLDDIDAMLTDAGYVVVNDGDSGTWSVYMSYDAAQAQPHGATSDTRHGRQTKITD